MSELLRRAMFPRSSYRENMYEMLNCVDEFLIPKENARHFLDYHFKNKTEFSVEFVDFMCVLDKICPGEGGKFIRRLGGVKGLDRKGYEQIVQALCEIIIAKKILDSFPAQDGYTLVWEPKGEGGKNPEFMVQCDRWRLFVEVKCPSLDDYEKKNRRAKSQLVGRLRGMKEIMEETIGKGGLALPLDNKIKDFLLSAEAKFSGFSAIEVPTTGLLFICWTERMFEAVTPLSNLGCGLLTNNSFLKDGNGEVIKFPNVSAVIVTQHQKFIQMMLAEVPFFPNSLDYGEYWGYGSPVNPCLCSNPAALVKLPIEVEEALQTVPAGESLDPISQPMDWINWL